MRYSNIVGNTTSGWGPFLSLKNDRATLSTPNVKKVILKYKKLLVLYWGMPLLAHRLFCNMQFCFFLASKITNSQRLITRWYKQLTLTWSKRQSLSWRQQCPIQDYVYPDDQTQLTYTQEYWIDEWERRCTRVHINLAYGANADKNRCRVVIVVCYLGECS